MPKYYEETIVIDAFTKGTQINPTWVRGILATTKEADVAPVVHAHWIYQKGVFADDGTKGIFECSACKAIIDMQTFDLMYGCGQTRRCGSCGANMYEEEKKMKPHNEVEYLGKNKYDWHEILLIDNENNKKIKLQFPSQLEASIVQHKLEECMSFCIEVVKK